MSTLLECDIPQQNWLTQASRPNGVAAAPSPPQGVEEDTAPVSNAGPWEPTVQSLVKFGRLGDDWDGQGAVAPSYEQLESAIGLAYTLYQNGVQPPSRVVPGPQGSVIFEWQEPDGTYAEVEQIRPFYAEVMVLEPGRPAKHWTLPPE